MHHRHMTLTLRAPAPRHRAPRPRRHGVLLEPADRRALERAGWRTTLEYREDHVRGRDGRLIEVARTWVAEAERYAGPVRYLTAAGSTVEDAWARLRAEAEGTVRPWHTSAPDSKPN